MKTNTFSTWVLWVITMVAAMIAYHFMHPALAAFWVVGGSAALIACSFIPLTLYAGRGRMFAPTGTPTETDSMLSVQHLLESEEGIVDPWNLQRSLMRMSDQQLPDSPMITKDVIMYYALILEEASEAGVTLVDILRSTSLTSDQLQDFALLRRTLATTIRSMDLAGRRVRQILETPAFNGWQGQPLTLRQARALLDDHVDIQVVNSGFGLAAGLPCQSGHLAVVLSNVSKAHPATGLIQKDASGKWLKGPNYKPPELDQVLVDRFPKMRAQWNSGFAPTQPSSAA